MSQICVHFFTYIINFTEMHAEVATNITLLSSNNILKVSENERIN